MEDYPNPYHTPILDEMVIAAHKFGELEVDTETGRIKGQFTVNLEGEERDGVVGRVKEVHDDGTATIDLEYPQE